MLINITTILLYSCYVVLLTSLASCAPTKDCVVESSLFTMKGNVFEKRLRTPDLPEFSMLASGLPKEKSSIDKLEIVTPFPSLLNVMENEKFYLTKVCSRQKR